MTTERTQSADHRDELMAAHRAARARREAAPLGSDEYRAAAQEIARIEVEINQLAEREVPSGG